MSWLKNIIDKSKQTVQNAVQNVTTGYGDWINGVQNTVQNTAQNTVQGFSQGVTDKINSVNNQIQGNVPTQASAPAGAVAPSAPPVSNAPANTPSATTPTSTPQVTTPTTSATPATTPSTSSPTTSTTEAVTGFDSYEDYINNNTQNIQNVYNSTVETYDKQNAETLKHIDESLEKGKEYATDVKETTDTALEEQKNSVYKYADELLSSTLGYNEEAYGKLVEAITGQMEAGKLAASEAKNLLMMIADEAKNATYGAAERQRTEAERQADINRQRAITDANSAYEQNKAGYGANAEALGNMGLSGGGYSDWINASAYAQNRSEVQGARAQSDAAKREAKYTEDMTKLQADQEYSNKKYQAESDYLNKMHEIDTSYRANMSEAEQSKLAADKAAHDTANQAKATADSDYAAGKLKSETEYKGFLYDLEAEADKNRLETNQKTELGKLEASNDYITAIMQNEGELAKFKEALKAEDKQAKQVQLSMYEKVLRGVSDGTYTAEDAAALANAFEFDQEWKDAIATAATTKAETDAIEKAKEDAEEKGNNFAALLIGASKGEYDEATVSALASQYGLSSEQTAELTKAAKAYATGKTGEMFSSLLLSAAKGEIDENAAKALAAQYGLNEEQTVELTKAAQAYATGETSDMYSSLLLSASKGEIDENTAKALAKQYGLSPEQTAELTKAANAAQSNEAKIETDNIKQISIENKHSIISSINPNTFSTYSDSYIDGLVKDKLLTKDDANAVKTYRNEQEVKNMQNLVKNGYNAEAAEIAEDLKARGVIDPDKYQKTYFEISVNDCNNVYSYQDFDDMEAELLNRKSAGKISGNDYKELTQYLYKNAGQSVNVFASHWMDDNSGKRLLQIKVGESSYEIRYDDYYTYPTASSNVSAVLDKIASANGNVNSVVLGGKLYCRLKMSENDIGWREVPVNEQFVSEYSRINGHKKKDDAPSHQTNSGSGGGIGNSGIAGSASNGKDIVSTYK